MASDKVMDDDYGITCSETRRLPLGGGANIICGYQSYLKEMEYRKDAISEGRDFDLPTWESLEIYFKNGEYL